MSTLTVATIKSLSGSPTVFQKNNGTEIGQLAMAWVNINGDSSTDGEFAIRDSFNISSVEDTATGVYTVNIDRNMANTNYCVATSFGRATGNDQTSESMSEFDPSTRSAGSFKLRTGNSENNTAFDFPLVQAVVFGAT
tara:strand:- start:398 stop:811 length:414 start_codon:yes stop_codon:yes gene_type:complete